MYKTQRRVLALLVCLCSTALFAQDKINVEISGIEKLLEDNVRLFLSVEQQKNHALMSEGRLRRLHKKAPEEIARALQPFGYYRSSINSDLTQSSPGNWQARYVIDPGPALLVHQFDFKLNGEMADDPAFRSLIATFSLDKGTVFNHLKYEDIKVSLARLAAERGYFNARFSEHRVAVDLDRYEARIQLYYEGGVRYRFGEVLLVQDVLEPELLQRYIPFEKGAPYTLNQLLSLQQSLNDSDYFRTVEVSPGDAPLDSAEIPVAVMLTPRNRHRYRVGLGYGTDTGVRTKFGWEIPRLNRRGHRINTEIQVSERGYRLGSVYRVPVLNPRTDQIIYSAGVVNETTDTSESTVRTVGVGLNRSRGQWRESVSINYQQENFVVADDRGRSTLLIPGVSWSRNWGRNFINALDGVHFDIGLRGARKNFLSNSDFFQLQGGVKTIKSLGRRNRIITRGRLGGTWTDEFRRLPSSVRFFAGGAQSVRGYKYQSLGPVDRRGNVVGGKYLMVGSIEFEHRFTSKWSAAIFYDGGNAFDDIAEKLERGAGLGVRWQSPVGPVRFDMATDVSRGSKNWEPHINIGPDF